MRQTYFRVQSGERNVTELLDPAEQTSSAWHHHHLDNPATTRQGVSVCGSREELAKYLATTGAGIPYGGEGWVLVELAGDISDDRPLDFEDGEYLVHPTEIISAQPIPDDFFDMIGAAYDARTDGGW